MAQRSHRPFLLLLIEDLELVLGQGLPRLRHHFNHIHDQDLERQENAWRWQTGLLRATYLPPRGPYPPTARDLLPLHEAGPSSHIAL